MSDRDDGGTAFPVELEKRDAEGLFAGYEISGGMSLRDYFAAKALPELIGFFEPANEYSTFTASTVAAWAYNIADAMIAERKKGNAA